MDVTCTTTKLAWKRNPHIPAGQPALGHFNCVCGNVIPEIEYAGPDSTCSQCGRTWDGRGWLVSEPTLHERRMQAVRENSPAVQDGPYAYLSEDKHLA